jgi:hypothetical protein
VLRISQFIASIVAVWYVALIAFAQLGPTCSAGKEIEGAVCYFGAENYGPYYHWIWWLSFDIALFVIFPVLALAGAAYIASRITIRGNDAA